MNGVSAVVKETPEGSSAPSPTWGHSEKTASMNQEAGPHQTLDLPVIWDFLQDCEKYMCVV